MCVANSARSQMAEGLAKQIFGTGAWIESAGSIPKTVNPFAQMVMSEVGIDLSSHYSKSFENLPADFTRDLNYIITLCAEEVCPAIASKTAKRLHWPFTDPSGHDGDEFAQLERFRSARDAIAKRIQEFKIEITNK